MSFTAYDPLYVFANKNSCSKFQMKTYIQMLPIYNVSAFVSPLDRGNTGTRRRDVSAVRRNMNKVELRLKLERQDYIMQQQRAHARRELFYACRTEYVIPDATTREIFNDPSLSAAAAVFPPLAPSD